MRLIFGGRGQSHDILARRSCWLSAGVSGGGARHSDDNCEQELTTASCPILLDRSRPSDGYTGLFND
jgi:hypothetical protein